MVTKSTTTKNNRSIKARNVALDVIKVVGKRGTVNKTELQIKHGYSPSAARSGKALETKTYKETIGNTIERIEKERTRLLVELGGRDISTERYATLLEGIDKLTKNAQLLGGKATENVAAVVNVVRYDDMPPTTP